MLMKRNPTAMPASSSDDDDNDDNDDDNDERESGQEDTKTQTPLSTLQVFFLSKNQNYGNKSFS